MKVTSDGVDRLSGRAGFEMIANALPNVSCARRRPPPPHQASSAVSCTLKTSLFVSKSTMTSLLRVAFQPPIDGQKIVDSSCNSSSISAVFFFLFFLASVCFSRAKLCSMSALGSYVLKENIDPADSSLIAKFYQCYAEKHSLYFTAEIHMNC